MVFYFSGTGNSEYTAKRIAEATGEEAIAIAGCLNNDRLTFTLGDEERIGFVFPVYFFGIPTIVSDFISGLVLQNYRDNYTYSVCTNGGDGGNSQAMTKRRLAVHGIRLDAAFEVAMPDNYILLFDLLTPADKAALMLEAAEGRIAAIIEDLAARKHIPVKTGVGRWLKTALSYPLYKYGRSTRPFYATADCNGCGLCAHVCPCLMIEMRDGMPAWETGKCTQCLACLHRCPERAIQHGRKTERRGRYLNPKFIESV
jgi:ferredoxin